MTDMNVPASRIEKVSWCLYDFANSSYTTVIVTVAFSVYFTEVVAGGGAEGSAARLWGWGYSLSMLAVAVAAPVLGAIADHAAVKKRFLAGFTLLCVVATALLYFVERGDVALGLALFALSNIGFNGGMHFYNSFLIDLADRTRIGKLSGYGWALGYVGGLVSLLVVYPLVSGGLTESNLATYRLSFPVTAAFFAVASIPAMVYLRERNYGPAAPRVSSYITGGLMRLRTTFAEIKRFRELLKYFAAYLLYTDAINTIIVFSAIFAAQELGFTPVDLIVYFIIIQITAAGGSLAIGPIMDRVGGKISIAITLVIWTGVAVCAYYVQTKAGFYALGLVAGSVIGANQSASRALLGLFTPHGKNAEFFGFFAAVGKLSAVIGPILYGEIAAATGSQRPAVLSLALFFIAGLVILAFVREQDATKEAEAYERG